MPEHGLPVIDNRRIRVFVSSTFRDRVEDRNELMTHVWPELRRFCQARQVEPCNQPAASTPASCDQ
jgi:hypothetical protein